MAMHLERFSVTSVVNQWRSFSIVAVTCLWNICMIYHRKISTSTCLARIRTWIVFWRSTTTVTIISCNIFSISMNRRIVPHMVWKWLYFCTLRIHYMFSDRFWLRSLTAYSLSVRLFLPSYACLFVFVLLQTALVWIKRYMNQVPLITSTQSHPSLTAMITHANYMSKNANSECHSWMSTEFGSFIYYNDVAVPGNALMSITP